MAEKKPNLEAIREWVAELRTTAVPQGRLLLLGPQGEMCCLAVACEVYRRHCGGRWSEDHSFIDSRETRSLFRLPHDVRSWFGLPSSNPALLAEDGETRSAEALNDRHRYSFGQIADAIERTYLTESSDA